MVCSPNPYRISILRKWINANYIFCENKKDYVSKNIIERKDNELIEKIYSAQKENPINGDFCKEVFEDMRMIGLNLNDNHIKGIPHLLFNNVVKSKNKTYAFSYLIQLQRNHNKTRC